MARTTAAQARTEIVGTARALFAESGYEGTSIQDIATAIGGSKAGVLYHFGSKALILRELMAPAAAALRRLVEEVEALDLEAARRRAIHGFVDLVLEFRHELSAYPAAISEIVELPELADLEFEPLGERLVHAMTGGSTRSVDVVAAHVACVGLLATTAMMMQREPCPATADAPASMARLVLDHDRLRADLIEVAERTLNLPAG